MGVKQFYLLKLTRDNFDRPVLCFVQPCVFNISYVIVPTDTKSPSANPIYYYNILSSVKFTHKADNKSLTWIVYVNDSSYTINKSLQCPDLT